MDSSSQSEDQIRGVGGRSVLVQKTGGTWLLVLSIIFVALILRAPITSVGPIVEQIQLTYGLSGGMTGLLTTLPLLAFAFFSPLAPKLASWIGMERSLLAASFMLAIAILIRSLPSVYALFLGTAWLGAAIAVANVLLPSLVKRDYGDRVGLMTGVYTVSMNLGAAVSSGISVPLTEQAGLGWETTLAISSIAAFIAAAAWLPLARASRKGNENGKVLAVGSSVDVNVWRSPLAWAVSLYLGLQSFCFYVNVTWIPLVLADKGLTSAEAGWMLSLMQIVSMLSTFIVPILAGKSRNQIMLALSIAVLFVVGYVLLWFGGEPLIPITMAVLGLGVGGGFGLAVMFFALRTTTSGEAAKLSGMAQSVGYLLAASGPLLLGLLHDSTESWDLPMAVMLAVSAAYALFGIAAGKNRKIQKS
ncbi:CynX/NimT family MFS transporter [Paenibacillus sp. GCM10027627]|uniref:CynX/NimT family MFS transporter n=1 Tax=unclassified Paenibacillus TaxID=185978 RepID=UPI00362F4164